MLRVLIITVAILSIHVLVALRPGLAQDEEIVGGDTISEEPIEGEIIPDLPAPVAEEPQEKPFEPPIQLPPLPSERMEEERAREGETRWNVTVTGAVMMNYVFNESSNNFTVKYRWEAKGQANAATAVIRGDADISADVQGPLSRWPTGECKLEVSIPKVPFEMTFRKPEGDRGTIKIVFKRPISEDWQSKCTFTDAPGARFNTRGLPESWLSKAMDKTRPSLKEITTEIGPEETTTRFVINKEVISDPPLGSGEIEGTGVVTVRPGGG